MENTHYVYVYLDPRHPGAYKLSYYAFPCKPIYIGKGAGNRLWHHLKVAKEVHTKQLKLDATGGSYSKTRELVKILKSGVTPIVLKVKQLLSEKDALKLEAKLIQEADRDYPGSLLNIRTNTWVGGVVKGSTSKRRSLANGQDGARLGTHIYYDTGKKCHHVLTPDELDRLVKSGAVSRDKLIAVKEYAKVVRQSKNTNPQKSRAGDMNGMFGRVSMTRGKKWFTVDGTDTMLLPEDARKLARRGADVTEGRSNFRDKVADRGHRIIFEGELRGSYRDDAYMRANKHRKYQYGLIWAPEKLTYLNNRVIKDYKHVETRPRARTKSA